MNKKTNIWIISALYLILINISYSKNNVFQDVSSRNMEYLKSIPDCQFDYIYKEINIEYISFIRQREKFLLLQYDSEKHEKIVSGISYDGKSFFCLLTLNGRYHLTTGSTKDAAAWVYRSRFATNPLYDPISYFVPHFEDFSLPDILQIKSWVDAKSLGMMKLSDIANINKDDQNFITYTFEDSPESKYDLTIDLKKKFPVSLNGRYCGLSARWAVTDTINVKSQGVDVVLPAKTFLKIERDLSTPDVIQNREITMDKNSFKILSDNIPDSVFRLGLDFADIIIDSDLGRFIKSD